MRRIRITRSARQDLNELFDWIASDNLPAAERTLNRIVAAIRGLERFATGKQGRIPFTFEKVVAGLPYILVYEIEPAADDETIVILFVQHTSRNYPRD